MRGSRQYFTLAFALAACAGPGVQGQAGAPPPVERVAPNIYELSPEQIAVAQQASAQEAPFIEVNGQATVELPADRAEISFAVETRGREAQAASAANANQMSRIYAALRGGNFSGLQLETFGYSLQPEYSMNEQRVRSIIGYVAHNTVRATVSNVQDVGRLIDVAVGAGANRVASIQFSASNTEAARLQAIAEAVRNARTQAEAIAGALGYTLGGPLEIRGGAQRPPPIMLDAVRMQAQAAPTPIEAGSQTVDANVTVRFAIGSEAARR